MQGAWRVHFVIAGNKCVFGTNGDCLEDERLLVGEIAGDSFYMVLALFVMLFLEATDLLTLLVDSEFRQDQEEYRMDNM